MGLMGRLAGRAQAAAALGAAAQGIAGAFAPGRAGPPGEDDRQPAPTRFDRVVNGLNRLPRPLLAFGTLGLFAYAMLDPPGFALRMTGLNAMPEPLWWLVGAIVAFYFGARESHYLRTRPAALPASPPDANPALDDWRRDA